MHRRNFIWRFFLKALWGLPGLSRRALWGGGGCPRGIPLSGKAGRKAESTLFEGKKAELAPFKKKRRNDPLFHRKGAESAFYWRRQGGIAKIQNGGIAEKRAELTVFEKKEWNRPFFPRAERRSGIRIGRERNSPGQPLVSTKASI